MVPVKTHYDTRTCFQNHVPFKGTNSSVIRAYLIRLRGRTYQGRTCRARVVHVLIFDPCRLLSCNCIVPTWKPLLFLCSRDPSVLHPEVLAINLCNHKYEVEPFYSVYPSRTRSCLGSCSSRVHGRVDVLCGRPCGFLLRTL